MKILNMARADVKFQFRHGFYYAYFIVSLLYIIMLRLLAPQLRSYITVLIIFSDPAVLGFFFIGGIVLLEKDQNILKNLFITPLQVRHYLAAKVLSLALLAIVTSLAIAYFGLGGPFNPVVLAVGVGLVSVFTTLLGYTLVVRVKSLNGYLITSPLYIIVFIAPLLRYFNLYDTYLFDLMPTGAALTLMSGALNSISIPSLLGAVLVLLTWIMGFYLLAAKLFYNHVVLASGGKK